ncbi:hypothetical protein M427DRAFT_60579 [Gonapodya prolifera JEL478]|uniref:Uncharacterized protein n=1 Tax=Gonapodya prolifera (strain JEL478) TaxID=1344416 RepID=A0A139A443_GONPJ|nr:hypothetical protein M427DRAFT_60579 [Gonapodya prolifera JEL478]|eukprot:KXS11561.1 hypothetical protein M427DRAFT_60579 [Gonapodya prolifera JEL478]
MYVSTINCAIRDPLTEPQYPSLPTTTTKRPPSPPQPLRSNTLPDLAEQLPSTSSSPTVSWAWSPRPAPPISPPSPTAPPPFPSPE